MSIDSSNFPLVYIRMPQGDAPSDQPQDLAAFDELLARKRAFVLLADDKFGGEHHHSAEERKQLTLWMKQNKPAIRCFIKGMILVEPNAARRLVAQAMAVMFGKFWGYPLMITESKAEALATARRLLTCQPDAALI